MFGRVGQVLFAIVVKLVGNPQLVSAGIDEGTGPGKTFVKWWARSRDARKAKRALDKKIWVS